MSQRISPRKQLNPKKLHALSPRQPKESSGSTANMSNKTPRKRNSTPGGSPLKTPIKKRILENLDAEGKLRTPSKSPGTQEQNEETPMKTRSSRKQNISFPPTTPCSLSSSKKPSTPRTPRLNMASPEGQEHLARLKRQISELNADYSPSSSKKKTPIKNTDCSPNVSKRKTPSKNTDYSPNIPKRKTPLKNTEHSTLTPKKLDSTGTISKRKTPVKGQDSPLTPRRRTPIKTTGSSSSTSKRKSPNKSTTKVTSKNDQENKTNQSKLKIQAGKARLKVAVNLKRKNTKGLRKESLRNRSDKADIKKQPGLDAEWIDGTDSSADEDAMQIYEEDQELEESLERKAAKNNLTVTNVKTILHHILTNEEVVAMMKNTLDEHANIATSLEPKMTRAKVREVIQKEGDIPHPWPISPIKRSSKVVPLFKDLSFADDEDDDDDFDPNNEDEIDSGDDEESIASSHDFGSPRPSTPSASLPCTPSTSLPSTPLHISVLDSTPKRKSTTNTVRFDLGEAAHPVDDSSQDKVFTVPSLLPRYFRSSIDESSQESVEMIANRTRSKCIITEPVEHIEEMFVPPDITADMYDTECNDSEWQDFLSSLVKTDDKDNNTTQDEDENDPEYNFLEDLESLAEGGEFDPEDFKNDKTTKVSKKELHELMDELFEAAEAEAQEDDESHDATVHRFNDPPKMARLPDQLMKTYKVEQLKRKNQGTQIALNELKLTTKERIQLDDQLRKHVQLLAQVNLLSKSDDSKFKQYSTETSTFLNELKMLSDAAESKGIQTSAFGTCNLGEAIEISRKEVSLTKSEENRAVKGGSKLLQNQLEILATSKVFMYPELLPKKRFNPLSLKNEERLKTEFTSAEDNLLTLGLIEFEGLDRTPLSSLIKEHLMPSKTTHQIQVRKKNLRARRSGDTLLKEYMNTGKKPSFPRHILPFDPSSVRPPCNLEKDLLPDWMDRYIKIAVGKIVAAQNRAGRKKKVKTDNGSTMNNIETTMNVINTVNPSIVSFAPGTQSMGSLSITPNTAVNVIILPPLSEVPTKGVKSRRKLKLDCEPKRRNRTKIQTPEKEHTESVDWSQSSEYLQDTSTCISPVKLVPCQATTYLSTKTAAFSKNLDRTETITESISLVERHILSPSSRFSPTSKTTNSIQLSTVIEPSIKESAVHTLPSSVRSNISPNTVTSVTATTLKTITQSPKTFSVPVTFSNSSTVQYQNTGSGQMSLPVSIDKRKRQVTPNGQQTESNNPLEKVDAMSFGSEPEKLEDSPNVIDLTSSCDERELDSIVQNVIAQQHKKSPASIIATVAEYMLATIQNKKQIQNEPSPTKLHKLTPKESAALPVKHVSPVLAKMPKSPRRKVLRDKVKAILPKGFILSSLPVVSPTKKIADSLSHKARRIKPIMIGQATHVNSLWPPSTRPRNAVINKKQPMSDSMAVNQEITEKQKVVGEHDSDSDNEETCDGFYDSQVEDEDDGHVDDTIKASTTVSGNIEERLTAQSKKKGKKRRDATIAMLAPDIIDSDPMRDERDTAFAQTYLKRVEFALSHDLPRFEKFLLTLQEFQNNESVIKIYSTLKEVLSNDPDLLYDFSGFLLPHQAMDCGCFMAYIEHERARKFLRKLEIYFGSKSSHFQKILKCMTDWQKKSDEVDQPSIQDVVKPLLRGQHHLLEEFSLFFPNEQPPAGNTSDYEEVTLSGSDQDSCENITLPDEDSWHYGTSRCQCSCHESQDVRAAQRRKHCTACSLMIINGQIYLHTKGKMPRKAEVIFHKANEDKTENNVTSIVQDEDDPYDVVDFETEDEGIHRISADEEEDIVINEEDLNDEDDILDDDSSNDDVNTNENTNDVVIPVEKTPEKTPPVLSSEKTPPLESTEKTQVKDISSTNLMETKVIPSDSQLPATDIRVIETNRLTGPFSKSKLNTSFMKLRSPAKAKVALKHVPFMSEDSNIGVTLSIPDNILAGLQDPGIVDSILKMNYDTKCEQHTIQSSSSSDEKEDVSKALAEDDWKKEEDRVILEMVKSHGTDDDVFQLLTDKLPTRSKTQVEERFQKLMKLLGQVESDDTSSESEDGDDTGDTMHDTSHDDNLT